MAKLPSEYVEGWAEDNAIYRLRARKAHRCRGNGASGEHEKHASACPRRIQPGEAYVEYVGEVPAWQSGDAHSIACALEFGVIRKADESSNV